MKFCPNCGHQLEDGAKFCPTCGAQLNSAHNQEDETVTIEHPKESATVHNQESAPTQPQQQVHQDSVNGQSSQPQLGFVGSIQYIMQHVFEFNGAVPESRKSVFWWGFLGVTLLNLVFVGIPYLGTILCWATELLLVAAGMRRLAYLEQKVGLGWLLMVPLVGLYPLFLMLMDRKAA